MAGKRKKEKPLFGGVAERKQIKTYHLLYEKVADEWKGPAPKVRRAVYVYKLEITRTVVDPHFNPLTPKPGVQKVQGFCLRDEIEDFLKLGIFVPTNSIFIATTPAMEARTRKDILRAYEASYYKTDLFPPDVGRYFCKCPFDALKRGIARVCFWYSEGYGGLHKLYTLDGKLVAR